MTDSSTPTTATIPPSLSTCLDDELNALRDQITARAAELASTTPVTLQNLNQAMDEVVRGAAGSATLKRSFLDYFPPFTLVCALLCLAFAVLGLVALHEDPSGTSKLAAASGGFLDIAKIFAGAIVGSTTSLALAGARSK
ncbi:hypothetical protein KIK84_15370 [Curvibacter sp. CHRR-16]|uniref:hypothetical protein n=1 Tax=Curvibacter sp. CHRR-16 TaxID=2835872 RepID=UPI001BDB3333|nr:hypothetical protein [Curvibacter sp. CHRR-16]MBT0571705.1 hypothetical protein [Curvibacter sp. CHRR-16]